MAFYKSEGHCRVPREYKAESGFGLGEWVHCQRKLFARKEPRFMAEHYPKLSAIGFVW